MTLEIYFVHISNRFDLIEGRFRYIAVIYLILIRTIIPILFMYINEACAPIK